MRWFRRSKTKQAKQETVRIGADHSWWVDADLTPSGPLAILPRPDSGPLPTMRIGRLALPAAPGPDPLPVEVLGAVSDEDPVEVLGAVSDEDPVEVLGGLSDEDPVEVLGAVSDEHPVELQSWAVEDNEVWTIDRLAAQAPGGVLVGRVGSDRHGWTPPRGLAELALDAEATGWRSDDRRAAEPVAEPRDLDSTPSITTPAAIDLRDQSPDETPSTVTAPVLDLRDKSSGSEARAADDVAPPSFDDWHLAGSLYGR